MRLTKEQLSSYEQNGYLLVPDCFSKDELEPIAYELPRVFEENTPRKVLERSGAVRSVFAPHVSNETFERLSRLPRMLEPARQLLGDDVYIHQFKINAKVALEGDQWEWHQDFVYWQREDSMPTPRALTAVLFMQEVNEFNGPMLVIPGSHKEGVLDIIQLDKLFAGALAPDELESSRPTWAATLTADLKYKIRKDILARMALKNDIHAIKGGAGSVLFFHSLLLHASSNNLSPWDRVCVFVTYNSISNTLAERPNPRPEYIAHRDFSPLIPLSQDALLEVEVAAL
jgi:ectoine hydroxylase